MENINDSIGKLKEICLNAKSTENIDDLERFMKELKTELFIKRDQVANLRVELEKNEIEAQNVNKLLAKTKTENEECKLNLSLMQTKMRTIEEELQKKREDLTRLQFQYKFAVTEIDTLKEDHQRVVSENLELNRTVEMLKAKQKYETTYYNEILRRDAHLKHLTSDLQEVFNKLQIEQTQAIQLANVSKLSEESLEISRRLATQNEKLKQEKDNFEKMYIEVNAKFEKLKSLIDNDEELNGTNPFTKIVFNLWKQSQTHFTEQINTKNDILKEMTNQLAKQTEINLKLIKQNDELSLQTESLQKEIELLKENQENCFPKQESVKIVD